MKFFKSTIGKILISIGVIYVIFAGWSGWNESSRIAQTQAIVEQGDLQIDSYAGMTGDRAKVGEHYYSEKMPGVSFLSTPFFVISKIFPSKEGQRVIIDEESNLTYQKNPGMDLNVAVFLSTIILSGLATIVTGYFLYLFSSEFIKSNRIRYLIPIIYCLGTIALSNALHLQGHATVALFSFLSFYIFYYRKERFNKFSWLLASGFLVGIGFLVEVSAFFVFLSLFLVLLFKKEWKNISYFSVGFLIALLILFVYNAAAFSGPLDFGYLNIDLDSPQFSKENIDLSYYSEQLGEKVNFENVEEKLSKKTTSLKLLFHPEFNRYRAGIIFRTLFFPERGLLIFSPILILSFIGLFIVWKKNKELFWVVIIIFFSLLWFRSSPYMKWWAGGSFGLRHFNIVIPFLMIPLVTIIEKINKKVVYLVVIISVAISLIGGLQKPADLSDPPILISQNHAKEIENLKVLENPLKNVYWEDFKKEGLDAPLIKNSLIGRSFDTRMFNYENRTKAPLFGNSSGVLVVDFKYLSIFLPLILIFLVWWGDLKWKDKIIGIIALSTFGFFAFTIQPFAFGNGWYEGEDFFMGEKGEVLISSENGQGRFAEITLKPHLEARDLTIQLNGEVVNKIELKDEKEIIIPINLTKGENRLVFDAGDCWIPDNYFNNSDFRCLSFQLKDFDLVKVLKLEDFDSLILENDSLLTGNVYNQETINNNSGYWFGDEMKINGGVEELNIRFNIYPYRTGRNLKINESNLFILKEGEVLTLDLSNDLELISNCEIPKIVEEASDERCLSFFIHDLELFFE